MRKPFFEVAMMPMEELEWWAACFSIDDNGDKPMLAPRKMSIEEEIKEMQRFLDG